MYFRFRQADGQTRRVSGYKDPILQTPLISHSMVATMGLAHKMAYLEQPLPLSTSHEQTRAMATIQLGWTQETNSGRELGRANAKTVFYVCNPLLGSDLYVPIMG